MLTHMNRASKNGGDENEHTAGSYVFDAWPDNRWMLTRNREEGVNYLNMPYNRTPNAPAEFGLVYDEHTRRLTAGGTGREAGKEEELAAKAYTFAQLVEFQCEHGKEYFNAGEANDLMKKNGISSNATEQGKIRDRAEKRGWIKDLGKGNARKFVPGDMLHLGYPLQPRAPHSA
jgi:hypothetical protein